MSFVGALLTDPAIPLPVRQAALARALADPGIPDPRHSTQSFWLKDPHPSLAHRQSACLPADADVVIIGSGISAASIAKTILDADPRTRIVILDARDACSGATGRNGGHILETADDFGELVDQWGLDAARKLMRFRLAHLHELLAVAHQLGLAEETQARKLQFLTAYFDDETWSDARDRLARFKRGLPDEAAEWVAYEGDDIPGVVIPLSYVYEFIRYNTDQDRNSSSPLPKASSLAPRAPCGRTSSSRPCCTG